MTTITPFPIRRLPPAEPQRTTCDAGRSARALPHVRSTFHFGRDRLLNTCVGQDNAEQNDGVSQPRNSKLAASNGPGLASVTATFSPARNAPHATALSSREPCRVNPLAPGDRSRATYIPRPALAAAICVSWTIALVAGVVLAMEIFG